MKALPFLDLIESIHRHVHKTDAHQIDMINEAAIFYSQELRPGESHTLFDGIYCTVDMEGSPWWFSLQGQEQKAHFAIGFKAKANYAIYNDLRSLSPHTLNDILTDCARAGIELTWSEETLQKYPFLNLSTP